MKDGKIMANIIYTLKDYGKLEIKMKNYSVISLHLNINLFLNI